MSDEIQKSESRQVDSDSVAASEEAAQTETANVG